MEEEGVDMRTSFAFAETDPVDFEQVELSQWSQVTPLPQASPWLTDMLRDVLSLGQLQTNWDSYGSPPLQPLVIEGAITFLKMLEIDQPPRPQICPVPGGGMQFEWHLPGRELEIEILPDGSMQYLAVAEDNQEMEGPLPVNRPSVVRGLVSWLMQP